MTDPEPSVARRMWRLLEPYHAVVYFAPEAREVYADAGLKGGWMAYFASRAAAMGPVPAEVVIATFYNFHPAMVRRAIPDAWRFSSPERSLEGRLRVADLALRRLLGDVDGDAVRVAARLARGAAESCDAAGRALFGAHAALPWPDEPHLALWHAATLLREFRGDGHVATLLANGIDGCEAHVMITSAGVMPAEMQQRLRGWSPEDWAAARARLEQRGLLNADGRLTEAGTALRTRIEDATDELSAAPYDALGGDLPPLEDAMRALYDRVVAGEGVPYPNPMGLTRAR